MIGWVVLVLASWASGAALAAAFTCRCGHCLQHHRPAPQLVDLVPTDRARVPDG